jgi:ATP-dependent exoDNAse (exonuclease V) alpha subunit
VRSNSGGKVSHTQFDVGLPRVISVAPGEKLLVRSNFLPGKLKNGDFVTVDLVKDDGELVLRDGRTIPSHFRQFTHGYATTSHAAQGKTVDHGILVLGDKGYQAANLKQAYVSNSRFRLSQTIFTTNKERAHNAMARESERPLAIEAIKEDTRNESQSPQGSLGEASKQRAKVVPVLNWTELEPKRGIGI